MTAENVQATLQKHASAQDAEFLQRFFKTGEGQYGAGDVFIGVRMPQTRQVAREFKNLPLREVQKLLGSRVHEHRMAALIILTLQYPQADKPDKQKIYEFYLDNLRRDRINNWDLVDVSAPHVIGAYLMGRSHNPLFELAASQDLWQRRAAIISTFAFIAQGDAATTLQLAEILLNDPRDLIHKAVGWALREVGKRCNRQLLLDFLDKHAGEMPRTMLRYSLEHLPPEQRRQYMKKKTDNV